MRLTVCSVGVVHGCTSFFWSNFFFFGNKKGVFTFFVEINMLFVWRGIVAFRVVLAYFSLFSWCICFVIKVNYYYMPFLWLACAPHDFSLAVREKSALWLLLVKADNLWRTCRAADSPHQFSRENWQKCFSIYVVCMFGFFVTFLQESNCTLITCNV